MTTSNPSDVHETLFGTPLPKKPKITLRDLFLQGQAATKEIRAAKSLREQAKTQAQLRRRTGTAHFRGETAETLNALAARIEAELQWKAIAHVTLFTEQTCDHCGTTITYYVSGMVEQQHKDDPTARRLLRSLESHPELPHRKETWFEHVPACDRCFAASAPFLAQILPLPLPNRPTIEGEEE